MTNRPPTDAGERKALAVLAVIAILAMAWLALPFLTSLLLGALLAFSLEPAYHALARFTRHRWIAALITVLVSGVIIVGALGGFVSVFVARVVQLSNVARQDLRSGGPLSAWVMEVTHWLARVGIDPARVTNQIEASIGEIASSAGGLAAALASSTLTALLDLFFALLTMYIVLRHWRRMVEMTIALSPLDARYTEALLEEFRRVGRTTMSGTIVTGIVQGALATIGYLIAGLPYPFFFGVTTAFASLLPGVGTLLVWVPAGLYLFATGHPAMAITELLWGALIVVGLSDYVIRPRLVRDETMPALLVFVALFGGLELLGLGGLIIGPLIMGLALAVLRLYVREQKATTR